MLPRYNATHLRHAVVHVGARSAMYLEAMLPSVPTAIELQQRLHLADRTLADHRHVEGLRRFPNAVTHAVAHPSVGPRVRALAAAEEPEPHLRVRVRGEVRTGT